MRILSVPGRGHENPYFQLFCDGLENSGVALSNVRDRAALLFAFDVLHVHFPTHFITESKALPAVFWAFAELAFFVLCKLGRKPIVYTVHDVLPFYPKNVWLLKPFLAIFYRLCDGYVFLSSSSREKFFDFFPKQRVKPSLLIPHSPYPCRIRSKDEKLRTRNRLRIDESDFVVGCLGSIKPYKNLKVLTELPRYLENGRRIKILVAGRVEPTYQAGVARVLSELPQESVVRIDRRVPDTELDELVQTCDVVLLPYTKGWNSGAAILILSNRTRMLASDLPIFRELEDVLPYWCKTFSTAKENAVSSIPDILNSLIRTDSDSNQEQVLDRHLANTSFARSTESLISFYTQRVQAAAPWRELRNR
jgi:glycosyltransferase involved in cell wall biosynthesis